MLLLLSLSLLVVVVFDYKCGGRNYRVQTEPPEWSLCLCLIGLVVGVGGGGCLGVLKTCRQDQASRQGRKISVNEAFSIEVIKMIKDSGELVHL